MSGRLWSLAAALVVQACASLGGGGGDEEDIRTHYTLRAGERTAHPAPLPAETPIYVDWYHADGSKKTVTGFRGFDFGGDERFEMVEVLNEDGSVQSYVYDFDGDGRVDQITAAAAPDKAKPAEPAAKPVAKLELAGSMPAAATQAAEAEAEAGAGGEEAEKSAE